MKTIQKLIAVSMFSFLTVSAFGQLNLGIQSATQAAVNAAAIARTASNLVTITNTTVQSGVTKAMDATTKLTNAVQGKADQALTNASEAADNASSGTSVYGSLGVNANSSAKQQTAGGSSTTGADHSVNADGNLNVTGSGIAVKVDKARAGTSASTTSCTAVSKQ